MVRKLVAYPRYDGHWSAMPFQRSLEVALRDADLQNEQRDRDREHPIAERLDPSGSPAVAHATCFDDGHTCPFGTRIAHAATITRSG